MTDELEKTMLLKPQLPLSELPSFLENVSPGVKDLVWWLRMNGFETTDSGDGSNHEDGMEGALPFPMVSMTVTPEVLVIESVRLRDLLAKRGVILQPTGSELPSIQASYDPSDSVAVIMLINVLSKDIE